MAKTTRTFRPRCRSFLNVSHKGRSTRLFTRKMRSIQAWLGGVGLAMYIFIKRDLIDDRTTGWTQIVLDHMFAISSSCTVSFRVLKQYLKEQEQQWKMPSFWIILIPAASSRSHHNHHFYQVSGKHQALFVRQKLQKSTNLHPDTNLLISHVFSFLDEMFFLAQIIIRVKQESNSMRRGQSDCTSFEAPLTIYH